MSSAYPDYVKSLNPAYYWRLVQQFNRGYNSYVNPTLRITECEPQEERQHADNADSNGAIGRSRGYYSDYSMPSSAMSPYFRGPLFGGESQSLNYFATTASGLRLIESGNTASTLTHTIPAGKTSFSPGATGRPFTWNIWVKGHADLALTQTQNWLSSASNSTDHHFMIGDNEVSGGGRVKIKTRLGGNDSNNFFYYEYDVTRWSMFTFVQKAVPYQATVSDGLRLYRNGGKIAETDANWHYIPESPNTDNAMWIYAMSSYKDSAGRKPGLVSEITAWERELNASEIASLYYQATSPSPFRVRGGLHRQLGRLV